MAPDGILSLDKNAHILPGGDVIKSHDTANTPVMFQNKNT
jgi:hypothetical protein